MNRREFLKVGAGIVAGAAIGGPCPAATKAPATTISTTSTLGPETYDLIKTTENVFNFETDEAKLTWLLEDPPGLDFVVQGVHLRSRQSIQYVRSELFNVGRRESTLSFAIMRGPSALMRAFYEEIGDVTKAVSHIFRLTIKGEKGQEHSFFMKGLLLTSVGKHISSGPLMMASDACFMGPLEITTQDPDKKLEFLYDPFLEEVHPTFVG